MSGEVGDHGPPHMSVLCSYQQMDVIGWSEMAFVLTISVFYCLSLVIDVSCKFSFNNAFLNMTVSEHNYVLETAAVFFLSCAVIVLVLLLINRTSSFVMCCVQEMFGIP